MTRLMATGASLIPSFPQTLEEKDIPQTYDSEWSHGTAAPVLSARWLTHYEFIERMHLLGAKLGPMLLQFPKFDKWVLRGWRGNRKGIEEQTTTWDKTVVDRQDDLKSWVVVLRRLVED